VKTFLALFSLHFWQQGSIQQKVLVSVIAIILVVVIAAAIFNVFKARRRPANTSASVDAASNTERSLEDVPRNHFLGQALLQGAELSSDVAARSGVRHRRLPQ
jgi:flagellar biosynthesis/type III secretory pathway M-ring protein FliF/YscJ